MGGVSAGVSGTRGRGDDASVSVHLTEENTAAFVGVGFLTVGAEGVVNRLG